MHYFANVFRFGWPYLRRYWVRLVSGLLLGILFGLLNAGILGISKALLNRVFPEENAAIQTTANLPGKESRPKEGIASWGRNVKESASQRLDSWLPAAGKKLDFQQALALLLLFPLLFACRGYIGYLSSYCMGWVSERVISDLRQDVFGKLSTLSLDFFNRSKMGDLLTNVHGDTSALHRSLNHGVSDLIKEPVTILSTFALLLWMDWQLTVFVMLFLPICIVPIIVLGKKARKASFGNTKTNISQSSLLVEFLASIRLVKAYNLEQEQSRRFANHSRELVHHGMKGIQAKEMVNPLLETIGALGISVLVLYILYTGKSGTDLAVFLAAVATVYTPIKKLAGLHVLFQQTSVGVDRLIKILREQPSVKEPARPRPIKPFSRDIRFENVTFGYGDSLVLRNFNLVITAGHKLGIAGESGSGKSTLVNLLFRFYDPLEGRVLLDGVDIREYSTAELRSQMALVSQEIILFDQSVGENIACGRPGATQDEVEAAARAAFAHDFIMQLPQGYATRVGERGVMLSGGQRQRIAIARAFIRQAPILALDEATAALDAQAEAEVQRAIDRIARERTVLCVAHRLSTLASMDSIIFMSEGQIREHGPARELLSGRGGFATMAQLQALPS